jgi:hypothetical protein
VTENETVAEFIKTHVPRAEPRFPENEHFDKETSPTIELTQYIPPKEPVLFSKSQSENSHKPVIETPPSLFVMK